MTPAPSLSIVGLARNAWVIGGLLLLGVGVGDLSVARAKLEGSLNWNGDVMLNEWIVAWVQHQLPRDPLNLFRANIFYPAPDSLALAR